jgi:hypothetical protein
MGNRLNPVERPINPTLGQPLARPPMTGGPGPLQRPMPGGPPMMNTQPIQQGNPQGPAPNPQGPMLNPQLQRQMMTANMLRR